VLEQGRVVEDRRLAPPVETPGSGSEG